MLIKGVNYDLFQHVGGTENSPPNSCEIHSAVTVDTYMQRDHVIYRDYLNVARELVAEQQVQGCRN